MCDIDEDSTPLLRICTGLIKQAVEKNASRLRLASHDKGIDVDYLVDGQWLQLMVMPPHIRNSVVAQYKLLAEVDIRDRTNRQQGTIRLKGFPEATVVFTPQEGGHCLVELELKDLVPE